MIIRENSTGTYIKFHIWSFERVIANADIKYNGLRFLTALFGIIKRI